MHGFLCYTYNEMSCTEGYMKIALVDDDRAAREQLGAMISAQLGGNAAIDAFSCGEDFLSAFTAGKYDLIILDIYMSEQNGVAVAEKIRETDAEVRLAFCTSSNEFATETYAVGAKDYLQKPITAEKVGRLLKKVDISQIEHSRSVLLPDGATVYCRRIRWAEYHNHRVEIHMSDGSEHICYASFADIAALLSPYDYFYSPTRGILLNFYEAVKISDGAFVMRDGKALAIARRSLKDAKASYADFQFRALSTEVDGR